MKTAKWVLLAGLVVMLMTMGCDKMMTSVVPQEGGDARNTVLPPMGRRYNQYGNWFLFFYHMPSDAPGTPFPISLGQDNGATGSTVTIWKDEAAQKMYAEFHMTGNWVIRTAHFTVKEDSASLEHNKSGNLVPGHFPGQTENSYPYDHVALVEVDWMGPWDEVLAMAAHCEAAQRTWDPLGDTWCFGPWETGWGGEGGPKTIKIPDFEVTMSFEKYLSLQYDRSFADVTLSGIGDENAGYNVYDGEWVGWCHNRFISMPIQGEDLTVMLYSCYDPALPAVYQNDGWDNVSWLINEYSGSNYVHWDYFLRDFNEVVYYLLGQYPNKTYLPSAKAVEMAERAETEGEGYYPELPGSWFAVICDMVDYRPYKDENGQWQGDYQPVFIEVDP